MVRFPPVRLTVPVAPAEAPSVRRLAVNVPPDWLNTPPPPLPTNASPPTDQLPPVSVEVPDAPGANPQCAFPSTRFVPPVWRSVPLPPRPIYASPATTI